MSEEAEVLFEIRGGIGLVTLNRPKALNSLTRGMCNAIRATLKEWERDPRVHAVVVVGAGEKAFCAGGDVVRVSKSYKEGTDDWRGFFHDEYLMNIAIDEFRKPYVSLVDGICMGGGVGVSIPGDFWVATEKTLFAMPETGLGLIPDVGGGWFLPRLPGEAGMYLALTGARVKAADLFALGLASHVVASADVPALVTALAEADIHCANCVKAVLDKFHADPGPAPLAPHMDQIDEIFAGFSVEDIMAGLKADGSEWALGLHDLLLTKSPVSMKVTFEQLRRGAAAETFREVMLMEYRIVNHILAGNDFHEGVRAILLDKDMKPAWAPACLAEVGDKAVADHFAPLGASAELDLARLG